MVQRRRIIESAIAIAAVLGAILIWLIDHQIGATMTLLATATILIAIFEADMRRRDMHIEVKSIVGTQEKLRREQQKLSRAVADFTATATTHYGLVKEEHERTLARAKHLDASLASITEMLADHGERGKSRQIELRRTLRSLKHEPLTQTQALEQLLTWFSPTAPLPAVGGWAMEPTTLVEITDLVTRLRPTTVLECGSGSSTVWVGHALARNGSGRVISLDHLENYAAVTQLNVDRHGLSDWADVRHAPLVPTETDHGTVDWYELDPEALPEIDLLIVDGPPAATGELARFPAVQVLADRLSPNAVIILDDTDRADEQEVARQWTEKFKVQWSRRLTGRATVLGLGQEPSYRT